MKKDAGLLHIFEMEDEPRELNGRPVEGKRSARRRRGGEGWMCASLGLSFSRIRENRRPGGPLAVR